MPALKISYDYLPFHLKKCFSYCALFPEDHRFDALEITRLWTATGITYSTGENNKVNDTRSRYLDELVDNGFLMKGDDNFHQYYVMHDLLHELSQIVSSDECLNISGSSFRADAIPPSIRHLSINIPGTKDEAHEAKLLLKRNLTSLKLVWGQQTVGSDVINGLQPHPNLRALSIINHGSAIGPSWLCTDVCFEKLEFLHLEGVSWNTLPPFGMIPHLTELKLKKIAAMHQFGPDYGGVKSFTHLKKIVLSNMPGLLEWVTEPDCQLFSRLENIECIDCYSLSTLPTSECSTIFPNLCVLQIFGCPKLSLPPIPCSSKTTYIHVVKEFSDTLFHYEKNEMNINGYYGVLEFGNMDEVKKMRIKDVFQNPQTEVENFPSRMSSDELISFYGLSTVLSGELSVRSGTYERIRLNDFRFCGESLSRALNFLPNLLELEISYSEKYDNEHKWISYFPGTKYQEKGELQFLSSSSLQKLKISNCKNLILPMDNRGGLLGLTSLQSLTIENCGEMLCQLFMGEADASMKPFPASLRELTIINESSKMAMSLLSNLTSLTHLELVDCENLTKDGFNPHTVFSIKKLVIYNFSNLKRRGNRVHFGTVENHRYSTEQDPTLEACSDNMGEIHRGSTSEEKREENDCDSLTKSLITEIPGENTETEGNIPYSIAADLLAEVARRVNAMSAGCFYQLEHLEVDTISGVLVSPICSSLSSTLRILSFRYDQRIEELTEDQEQALELLTSLQELTFEGCYSLRGLPKGLHRLCSLTKLVIRKCPVILSLPEEGLPTSLKELVIDDYTTTDMSVYTLPDEDLPT
ncbi:unnamed protein product, partial [Urochloa humidicola]